MSKPADGAVAFFSEDHRACDEAWAALEGAASSGDAAKARALWVDFDARLRRHLAMEEQVLFPAIEDATGMRGVGPVAVMLHEHQQMKALLAEMGRRAQAGDFEGVLDQGDTLLMLIQQHNAKEENVLYPMADNVLASRWAELAPRFEAMLAGR